MKTQFNSNKGSKGNNSNSNQNNGKKKFNNKSKEKFVILPTAPVLIPADYSVFQKTAAEKQDLKSAKSIYKAGMKDRFGANWRHSGFNNVPFN